MHKKLEAELIHLAHQILKINNLTDINELRDKARVIYENLSVLSFIDEYFVETPEVTDSKEDFIDKLRILSSKNIVDKKNPKEPEITPEIVEKTPKVEEVKVKTEKEETEKLIEQTVKTIKTEAKEIASKIQETPKAESVVEENSALAEEMKHSIPADVAADMFEKVETFIPKNEKTKTSEKTETVDAFSPNRKADIESIEVENKTQEKVEDKAPNEVEKTKVNIATKQKATIQNPTNQKPTSLNDRISNQKIQVGLNDRIAFVKHLFNFSQEDFNRVLSQLNTFTSEFECKDFIENKVKPDYNWDNKEEYEARLIALVERKFK